MWEDADTRNALLGCTAEGEPQILRVQALRTLTSLAADETNRASMLSAFWQARTHCTVRTSRTQPRTPPHTPCTDHRRTPRRTAPCTNQPYTDHCRPLPSTADHCRPQGSGLLRPLITAATESSISCPLRKPAQQVLAQLQISDYEISRASAELKSGASEVHASAELALADGECSSRRRSSVMELMRQVSNS